MKRILLSFIVISLFIGCQVENINYSVPVMTTYEPQNVLATSASLGGVTLSEGGKEITEYGIVYGTNPEPTINDNKKAEGSRLGDFYNNYEVFNPGTTYYYRSYGTNATGTGYGDTYTFTTSENAPCNPTRNNYVNLGNYFGNLDINYVDREDNRGFVNGNVVFVGGSGNSIISINVGFNEVNGRLPLTGTYTTVYGFDTNETPSEGKIHLGISNYNGGDIGGDFAPPGLKVYVQNNNGVINFIFCDLIISQYYKLNGKFTYTP